jgi:putative heme iron utilization protein
LNDMPPKRKEAAVVAEPAARRSARSKEPEPEPEPPTKKAKVGKEEKVPEPEVPALKARWLARHPYAALYADFGDFALWRIRPMGALLVGGFARATRLKLAELLPDHAALEAAE